MIKYDLKASEKFTCCLHFCIPSSVQSQASQIRPVLGTHIIEIIFFEKESLSPAINAFLRICTTYKKLGQFSSAFVCFFIQKYQLKRLNFIWRHRVFHYPSGIQGTMVFHFDQIIFEKIPKKITFCQCFEMKVIYVTCLYLFRQYLMAKAGDINCQYFVRMSLVQHGRLLYLCSAI